MGTQVYGIGVSAGIAFGKAVILPSPVNFEQLPSIERQRVPQEQQAFNDACQALIARRVSLLTRFGDDSPQGQLIEAELMLLEDEEFTSAVTQAIQTLRLPAFAAVYRVVSQHAEELQALDDDYLAARANDILSLGQALIRELNGDDTPDLTSLTDDSIIIADDMTPAEFAALPLKHIRGLVLKQGGLTSHTAILARAAGIPALLNCQISDHQIHQGTDLILDANGQTLHIAPSANTHHQLTQRQAEFLAHLSALNSIKDKSCQTRDGHSVTLLANVGCKADIDQLLSLGGDGVGLLRTELMLLNAPTLPDEEEQFKAYLDCLTLLDGKPFTVRTLDIGADKALAALKLPTEVNPALGFRGVRYTLVHLELFRTQLRALLRVANHGPVRLMFPMLNQVEELDTVMAELEFCRQQLLMKEQGYGDIELGVVVETPAAALNLESMLPWLDFVSIGTNDLTQYTMAVDRTVPALTRAYPTLSPPLLKLIKHCIDTAHSYGLKVSMCGELAGNPKATAMLLGLGLDEFSLSPSNLLQVKAAILNTSLGDATDIAQKALKCQRLDALQACIDAVNSGGD